MVESSIVVYPVSAVYEIVDLNVGSAGQVTFNFERLWEFSRNNPFFSSVFLKFYHVHPQGYDRYSSLDLNCMHGLWLAFRSEIMFNIILFENDDPFDVKHRVLSYMYNEHKKPFVIEPEPILNRDKLILLKYLSYGGLSDTQEV